MLAPAVHRQALPACPRPHDWRRVWRSVGTRRAHARSACLHISPARPRTRMILFSHAFARAHTIGSRARTLLITSPSRARTRKYQIRARTRALTCRMITIDKQSIKLQIWDTVLLLSQSYCPIYCSPVRTRGRHIIATHVNAAFIWKK